MKSTSPVMKSLGGILAILIVALPHQNRVPQAIAHPQTAHPSKPTQSSTPKISPARRDYLVRLAKRFTVKVETPDNQGSGVIVKNQAGTYSVITNEHVVLDSEQVTIQTYDGRIYSAKRQSNSNLNALDLKLLEFQGGQAWYPVAMLKPGLASAQGSPVLAAGFPHEFNGQSFKATEGKISYITNKGLNGGYRIGYSNWVPKGMSGGPVINAIGQVIAINGLHAEPLWGNPYVWDDGTLPSDKLFQLFSELSWAIPTEVVLQSISTHSTSFSQ